MRHFKKIILAILLFGMALAAYYHEELVCFYAGLHGEDKINFWILIVLGFHAVVFTWQAFSLDITVKDASYTNRETTKSRQAELRAYVHVEHCQVLNPEEFEHPMYSESTSTEGVHTDFGFLPRKLSYNITIRNNGKTPAKSVRVDWDYSVAEFPIKTAPLIRKKGPLVIDDIPELYSQTLSIGPNGKIEFPLPFKRGFKRQEVTSFGEYGNAVYIHGTITYRDAFPDSPLRTSNFCFVHRRKLEVIGDSYTQSLTLYHQYNDAT